MISNIKFIFNHFTPVNSYRNLYNQDVNKTDREDIDLSYHYTYLSPIIEEKINVSSNKINKLEEEKIKLENDNKSLQEQYDLLELQIPTPAPPSPTSSPSPSPTPTWSINQDN